MAIEMEWLTQAVDNSLGQHAGALWTVQADHQNRELVAAQPGQGVVGTDAGP